MAGDAFRSLSGLALDPLSLRPWELAELTDWQIEGLYLTPAAERADRWEREHRGGHAPAGAGHDLFAGDRMPTFEEFDAQLGGLKSADELRRDYATIAAARAARRGEA